MRQNEQRPHDCVPGASEGPKNMKGLSTPEHASRPISVRIPGASLIFSLYPGVIAAAIVAIAASWLSQNYNAPVMLFALLLGMALAFLSEDSRCRLGVNFSSRTILRFGVALLGLRISASQIAELGAMPVAAVVAAVSTTLGVGYFAAQRMGLRSEFGVLSGGAVGICGASAALAISAVLPSYAQKERDTVLTVIGVTTLSTIAMVSYPSFAAWLGLTKVEAGVFIGASIHDVAQVVGAGYIVSQETGDVSTYVKLMRVALLVPIVAGLSFAFFSRLAGAQSARAPMFPMFLVVFCALVALNSFIALPVWVTTAATQASSWCLVVAIAALGMKTSLRELARVGWKPVILIGIETAWIAVVALSVIVIMR